MLGFLLYLLVFHWWLCRQGYSTYEYILWKRLRDRLLEKTRTGELSRREYKHWLERTTPRNIIMHDAGKLKHQFGEGSIHNDDPEALIRDEPKYPPKRPCKERVKEMLCRSEEKQQVKTNKIMNDRESGSNS